MTKVKEIAVNEFKALFADEKKAEMMRNIPFYADSYGCDHIGDWFINHRLNTLKKVELYKHCDYYYIQLDSGSRFRTKKEVIEALGLIPKTSSMLGVVETTQADLDKMTSSEKDDRIAYLEQTLNKIIGSAVEVNMKWKSVPTYKKYGTYASDAIVEAIKTTLGV